MTAPLYLGLESPKSCDGNHGLWFDRFFDQYDPTRWEVLKPTTNNNALGGTHWLIKHFKNQKVGIPKQLDQYIESQHKLAEMLGGKSLVFQAGWHFVTGMGNSHPVENGFAWHPTLGVPYLTGAAVKGLVRSYIETNLRTDAESGNPEKEKLLFEWFGSTNKDPQAEGYQSQAGELIFFDALPIEPVSLGVDIMTPHMGKWYEKGAAEPNRPETTPADWHDPVPVSFLVANNISLQFSFALRQYSSVKGRPEIDLADVTEVLERVLQEMGAGAKTATGYGELVEVGKLEQRAKDAEKAKAFENATRLEGYYLKIDRRNGSLILERGKEVARLTGTDKVSALLDCLPSAEQQTLKVFGVVKVDAWVSGKEILQVDLFEG